MANSLGTTRQQCDVSQAITELMSWCAELVGKMRELQMTLEMTLKCYDIAM